MPNKKRLQVRRPRRTKKMPEHIEMFPVISSWTPLFRPLWPTLPVLSIPLSPLSPPHVGSSTSPLAPILSLSLCGRFYNRQESFSQTVWLKHFFKCFLGVVMASYPVWSNQFILETLALYPSLIPPPVIYLSVTLCAMYSSRFQIFPVKKKKKNEKASFIFVSVLFFF